jgi:CPA1 family monovalent cation:H+ antiporter
VLRRRLVAASRNAIEDLRSSGTIGDDAFRRVEEELDWLELSAGLANARD